MDGIQLTIDKDHIARLVIDRPHVRNALNWATMESFAEAIEELHTRQDVLGLVVTGGGATFVSGGDLSELQDYPGEEDGRRLSTVMGDALFRLESLPMVTIAAINGPARGGGAEIAVACDLRVMAENADIGFVHSRLGIVTAWGGGQRLLRCVGYSTALELLTTGRVLSAGEAARIGLASRVVPEGQAGMSALETALAAAANPSACVQASKRLLRGGLDLGYQEALLAEREEFPPLWDTDFRREAVENFLKRSKKARSNGRV